jgi:hypothetical protein
MESPASLPPSVLPEQQMLNGLIKRILKLRWMGLEDEARGLESQLTRCPVAPPGSVLGAPLDTD